MPGLHWRFEVTHLWSLAVCFTLWCRIHVTYKLPFKPIFTVQFGSIKYIHTAVQPTDPQHLHLAKLKLNTSNDISCILPPSPKSLTTTVTLLVLTDLFCVESLGFSTYKVMLSVNRDNSTSSFLMGMFFVFSCLIERAGTLLSFLPWLLWQHS